MRLAHNGFAPAFQAGFSGFDSHQPLFMKNHWTDKRALTDFINEVSDKIAKIIHADPARIRQAMWDDVNETPLDDEEMRMIRDMELNDELINKMAGMIPDEELKKLTDADCGLW